MQKVDLVNIFYSGCLVLRKSFERFDKRDILVFSFRQKFRFNYFFPTYTLYPKVNWYLFELYVRYVTDRDVLITLKFISDSSYVKSKG